MFRKQGEEWLLLRKGTNGLAEALTRRVLADGDEVLVRHIPHRVASTTAAVDRESIAKRPCFLCAKNLPPEQKGLAWGDGFTLLCNPFPIVEKHLTVVHREHRPQRIAGQVGTMLDLAAALPGFFVIYNGPQCGASAPDHLHLQAGSRDGLPIVREAVGKTGPTIEAYGMRALLFRGPDRSRVLDETERALAILSAVTGKEPEPWCNVAAFHDQDAGFTVVLFPRSKHRPDAFHAGDLAVSPATIDMSGILVAPFLKDFERLSGEDVAAVYGEVTIPEDQFRDALSRLESRC
ncbi:MAG TPA: DUF4922 domain-containing protein [Thermoanaerobaculia bacterium]|nr:DUF4922 domain-containing protein [Thermoanaerobaculia bacterium]